MRIAYTAARFDQPNTIALEAKRPWAVAPEPPLDTRSFVPGADIIGLS
jgi:hypothetical protein